MRRNSDDFSGVLRLVGEVDGRSMAIVLQSGEGALGALADCAYRVPHSSVSRRHAMLWVDGLSVVVKDLESTNGIAINGRRCRDGRLEPGDWLEVGAVPLFLEYVETDETTLAIVLDEPSSAIVRREEHESTELMTSGPRRPLWLRWLNELASASGGTGFDQSLVEGAVQLSGSDAGVLLDGQTVAVLVGPAEALDPETTWQLTVDGALLRLAGGDRAPDVEAAVRLAMALRQPPSPEKPSPDAQRSLLPLEFPEGHVQGTSQASRRVYDQIRAAARGRGPVLITGETGVGKEHVVRILHGSSDRAGGPLQSLNCAAIPAELLEAELFGIEAGVATGVSERKGAMRLADGGIVFFDEIGDMGAALQAKLLRALQEGEVQPVGARRPVPVDVRIVAATNTDLEAAVRDGGFRADLYYRLAGHLIEVSALRHHRDDIPALVDHLLRRAVEDIGIRPAGLSLAAFQALQGATWPGNIRQLENELRRAVTAAGTGVVIERRHLSPDLAIQAADADTPPEFDDLNLKRQVDALERRLVQQAIHRAHDNLAEAARQLGLSRNGLVMKMQRLGLTRT
jgi:DNA-binding NtrC family response regulator